MASRQMKAQVAKMRAQHIELAKQESYKTPYLLGPDKTEMLQLAHNWFGNVRRCRAGSPNRINGFRSMGSGVSVR